MKPATATLLLAAGLVASAVGTLMEPAAAAPNLLLVSLALVTFGLAGLFGLALLYPDPSPERAGLRRTLEALCRLLPLGAAGLVIVLLAAPWLYPWTEEPLPPGFRAWWLSRPFFLARTAAYLGLWLLYAARLTRLSRERDAAFSASLQRAYVRWAVSFFYVLGVTLLLAGFDWIMSLDPHWYSTIFGLYQFGGLAASGCAATVLLLIARGAARPALLHDLGQLLLAFCCAWAYLWFSQYLLIWYVNIPEEAVYYTKRTAGGWGTLFYLNPVLGWLLPFLALLPREAKERAEFIGKVAVVVLVARWLDLYLMIVPTAGASPAPGPAEIGAVLVGAGLASLVLRRPGD